MNLVNTNFIQFKDFDRAQKEVTALIPDEQAWSLYVIMDTLASSCARKPRRFSLGQRNLIKSGLLTSIGINQRSSQDGVKFVRLTIARLLQLSDGIELASHCLLPSELPSGYDITRPALRFLSDQLLSGYTENNGKNSLLRKKTPLSSLSCLDS